MSTKNFHQSNATVEHWMDCYNVTCEPNDDDSQNIDILQPERNRIVEGSGISNEIFLNPRKIKKVSIGSLKNPTFSNIKDY